MNLTKSLFLALTLAVTLALSGCLAPKVPATQISFNPKTEALKVTSPKDVTIGSVSISQSNGVFSMTVTDYKSTNNPSIVSTISTAQAMIASNAAVTINGLAQLGVAAAKAAQ